MSNVTPFHVAVPVFDLHEARLFYTEVLGCTEGRTSEHWADFNLYGHQFVVHLKPKLGEHTPHHSNPVDGHDVPVPHYGVVLEWDEWQKLEKRLREHQVNFVIEPYIRFKGLPGEQATMFFMDPSGNALEFKSFKDFGQLFAL
jgi:extradiol dioxygenase family protein